jgi:predicted nucleic acid-binding Zn finger protein
MSDLFVRLAEKRGLDENLRQEIEAGFGPRGKKALAALDNGKVKKYHDFFVVEGRTGDYVVDEDFCTCGDFMYRNRTCWHLVAVRIAVATGMYVSVDGWYVDQMK